jgi:catechol 2,3-dioxygenase-like lactoylglutathione lyase family enzyme
MDWKLELVVLPVSDVDRAKSFYTEQLGFRLDVDHKSGDAFRVVQMTPPGSACSITIGVNVGAGEPGTTKGLHLVVDDIEAARRDLSSRGVDVGDVQDFAWGRFLFFSDPDGNRWGVQQISARGQ